LQLSDFTMGILMNAQSQKYCEYTGNYVLYGPQPPRPSRGPQILGEYTTVTLSVSTLLKVWTLPRDFRGQEGYPVLRSASASVGLTQGHLMETGRNTARAKTQQNTASMNPRS
jgi:hypothetical protein